MGSTATRANASVVNPTSARVSAHSKGGENRHHPVALGRRLYLANRASISRVRNPRHNPTPAPAPQPTPTPTPTPTPPTPTPTPAPEPQPTPTPAPTPNPTSNLLFKATHLNEFWLNQSAPGTVTEVPDPAGSGESVFQMTVNNKDVYPITPTENPRAELLSPETIKPGEEFW